MWDRVKSIPPVRVFITQSPRKILFFNSLILAICFIAMSGFSFLVCALFYQSAQATDTIFFNWLVLGIVGVAMTTICIIGMRGAHLVSFELLLFYFWGITMFIGPMVLAAIAGFDFYVYISVWFQHYWQEPTFSEIRQFFCEGDTYDRECVAPIFGGPDYNSLDEWCMDKYGHTDCAIIRNRAESDALELGRTLILAQGIMGIVNVLQIALSMYICTTILTASVITQSMNDTINYLLMLPIGGTSAVAAWTWWMRKYDGRNGEGSEMSTYWVPYVFLSLSIFEVIQMPLGIGAGRLKSRIMLGMSIFLLSVILIGLAAAGVACILFAILWSDSFTLINRGTLQDIACFQELASCCCCDDFPVGANVTAGEYRCPEWSDTDIIGFVIITLKISGIISFLAMIYFFGAVTVAEILRQNLKHYKSDYI